MDVTNIPPAMLRIAPPRRRLNNFQKFCRNITNMRRSINNIERSMIELIDIALFEDFLPNEDGRVIKKVMKFITFGPKTTFFINKKLINWSIKNLSDNHQIAINRIVDLPNKIINKSAQASLIIHYELVETMKNKIVLTLNRNVTF